MKPRIFPRRSALTMLRTSPSITPRFYGASPNRGYTGLSRNEGVREVARVLQQRGDRPGLVHIISAMEACDAYKPWHDKQTHKTFIRPDSGKRGGWPNSDRSISGVSA